MSENWVVEKSYDSGTTWKVAARWAGNAQPNAEQHAKGLQNHAANQRAAVHRMFGTDHQHWTDGFQVRVRVEAPDEFPY